MANGKAGGTKSTIASADPSGRWPANVILDEDAGAMLDAQSGLLRARGNRTAKVHGNHDGTSYVLPSTIEHGNPSDSGGASRFFYCAKASKREREAGLGHLDEQRRTDGRDGDCDNPRLRTSARRNTHPTVKPLSLMRWLVRLITPPGGLVLDPFTGSGSTGCAAVAEGFRFTGCELSDEYAEIARARIAHWKEQAR
jgi:site-specific DNA-methyltransferase (adenine-specific)